MNLNEYQKFVEYTTSDTSASYFDMERRLRTINNNLFDVKVSELLTSALGLGAEAGEYTEVVKKIIFQGKPLSAENIFHMKRELGDLCWYLAVACTALNTSIDEILEMNVEKLSARYPDGFEIARSEVREKGDV